jgi:hypothetical protein
VAAPNAEAGGSWRRKVDRIPPLLAVYALNLLLYAGPLTVSGYGITSQGTPPRWFVSLVQPLFGSPTAAWRLSVGFVQNSAFLTAISALTLVTYHGAVVLTWNSRGFVLTLHTVIYSVSAYLAAIFTIVVFISNAAGFETARALVLNLQLRFITVFYDIFDVPLEERAFTLGEPADTANLTDPEIWVLAILVLLVGYFIYSLYLGTRLNHRSGVTGAFFAVLAVSLAPALYIIILLVYSLGGVTV